MRAKQDKYIDLNQLVHNEQGKISWKDSIGLTIEFFYNGKRHEIDLLEKVSKDYIKIKIDGILTDKVHTTKITKLMFEKMLYEPKYLYEIGDIVNNLLVLEQYHSNGAKKREKMYKCRCLNDGYEHSYREYDLSCGVGCPVCSNSVVVKGFNDIATTDTHLLPYFLHEEDAFTHSRQSDAKVDVICQECNTVKTMRIADLVKNGRVSCDKCSDGISYPNKFAHELFRQLNSQYKTYESEYSPNWADKFRYDNYVELLDGRKLLVEMDGGFHYIQNQKYRYKNDSVKDDLAKDNGFEIIRINCSYSTVSQRYSFIKNNVIGALTSIFDLSDVDWDKCNKAGLSNKFIDVISYYNNNPILNLRDIAKDCNISLESLYEYLHTGEDLGLCTYIRSDPNRIKNSKPIAMYNAAGELIGVYKSAKQIAETFSEMNYNHRQIRSYATRNKPYKNHIFRFATYEEYQQSYKII